MSNESERDSGVFRRTGVVFWFIKNPGAGFRIPEADNRLSFPLIDLTDHAGKRFHRRGTAPAGVIDEGNREKSPVFCRTPDATAPGAGLW